MRKTLSFACRIEYVDEKEPKKNINLDTHRGINIVRRVFAYGRIKCSSIKCTQTPHDTPTHISHVAHLFRFWFFSSWVLTYVLKLFTLWSVQQNSIELFENTLAEECRDSFLFTLKNGSYTQKYTNKFSPLLFVTHFELTRFRYTEWSSYGSVFRCFSLRKTRNRCWC